MVISALAHGGRVTVVAAFAGVRVAPHPRQLGKNYRTDPRAQSSGVLYETISSGAVKEKGKRVADG
jgi:hypothetical protein